MAGLSWSVKLEGVRRLTRALALVDPLLRKELGRRNKDIGQRVIDNASPKPLRVGAGHGALPRASANANVLQIMAGGGHRDSHKEQWGPRWVPRDHHRPFIALAGERDMPQIEKDYLDAVHDVARKGGLRFEKRVVRL